MNPDRQLEDEHNTILVALRILEALSQQILAGTAVSPGDIADMLAFLKEFADKCHHGKEEGSLFPALLKADAHLQDPVMVMLAEHAEGRKLVRAMETAAAPPCQCTEFVVAAKNYISLLQAHIAKENQFLFPAMKQLLSAQQLEAMANEFDAFEKKVIGAERHEYFQALLGTLKAKYCGPAASAP